MYDLTTYFSQSLPSMMPRKSINTVLFSIAADKLSQREWDWIKLARILQWSPAPFWNTATILSRSPACRKPGINPSRGF